MLSDIEKSEIDAVVAKNHDPRAACVETMKIIQSHRGYVSDEALQDLADILRMSPEELDGVATFCSLIFRKPVGRHVLKVCDSVSCWIMGGESVMQYLEKKLNIKAGETTSDGRITLLSICCLGDCDHAPAMLVDDKQVGNLTPDLLDKILESPELA
jgi:NADH-quinone oxidoreductase subunit E